eukprot:3509689-Amphidinium_carterae.1
MPASHAAAGSAANNGTRRAMFLSTHPGNVENDPANLHASRYYRMTQNILFDHNVSTKMLTIWTTPFNN